uniref:RNA m5u methyltransferase n=1 Tax=Solanum tuberosum TaxID=4113 RepID=M0ZRC0_SOLTU
MAAAVATFGIRSVPSNIWLHKFGARTAAASIRSRSFTTLASLSPVEDTEDIQLNVIPKENARESVSSTSNNNNYKSNKSYYPKRGQTLELVCESLAFKGKGVCKVADSGFVLMCDRALPGERFIGRVTRKKDNYAEVKKLKTITPHSDYVEAPCEYASHCGGCKTQSLSYEAQLKAKEQQVCDLVVHVGKFSDQEPEFAGVMKPIVPCDIQFHYRNKESEELDILLTANASFGLAVMMEFSFGPKGWVPAEQLQEKSTDECVYALGLHAPGFFDKVLNVNKCLLQSDSANEKSGNESCATWRRTVIVEDYGVQEGRRKHHNVLEKENENMHEFHGYISFKVVLATVQECWRDPELGLSPWNVHSHTGFLKHLMLRSGRNIETGLPELMVNFVTSSDNPECLRPLVEKIATIPEVVSIVNNVNTSIGNTSVGEKEYTLYGKSTITEILRGLTFQISANSFFQTNTRQADVLYKLIEDCAFLKGDGSEIVLDLFCGTGTIGLTLAKRVKHVYGFEVVAQAVSDARQNATLNFINNATFIEGDLNKIDSTFASNLPKPDIVITDPNRPGMHIKLIKFLLRLRASRIIYVSCNPATCARDLNYLCYGVPEQNIEGRYRLSSLQPVDMFPHTPHIECVCSLELR